MSADIGLQIAVNGAGRAMLRLSLPDTPRASVGASITTRSRHSRRIEPINVHNFITIAMEVERRGGAGWGYLLEGHNTCPVCSFCNLSAAVLPGAMFHIGSSPGGVTSVSYSSSCPTVSDFKLELSTGAHIRCH